MPYHKYPQSSHLNCALPSGLNAPKNMRSMNRVPAESLVRRVEWQVGQAGADFSGIGKLG